MQHHYLALRGEMNVAAAALRVATYRLKHTARMIEHRSDELVQMDIPDAAELQAALDRHAEARRAACEAWDVMTAEQRAPLLPPC